MKFIHWSQNPQLRGKSFLAINLSNHNKKTKKINDQLFPLNRTGHWGIAKEIVASGLVNELVVIFYSSPGKPSVMYMGRIKGIQVAGKTNHKPPRNRHEIEVYEHWQEIGQTEVAFSSYFAGAKMNSAPTAIWIDGGHTTLSQQTADDEQSNSYCEMWLEGQWRRVPVTEARMHIKPLVRCVECHGKVTLMAAGPSGVPRAHAEHKPKHKGCSLSQKKLFDGVRWPHPNPVQEPVDGSRDPYADLIVNEDESSFPEGVEIYRLHKYRERDRELALKAKALRYQREKKLECEVCQADFHKLYGELGLGFIECHHKIPVAALDGSAPTKIEDLAMVCSNCHSMLHRKGLRTVEELKQLFQEHAGNPSAKRAG